MFYYHFLGSDQKVKGLAAPSNLSMNQTLEGHSGKNFINLRFHSSSNSLCINLLLLTFFGRLKIACLILLRRAMYPLPAKILTARSEFWEA